MCGLCTNAEWPVFPQQDYLLLTVNQSALLHYSQSPITLISERPAAPAEPLFSHDCVCVFVHTGD